MAINEDGVTAVRAALRPLLVVAAGATLGALVALALRHRTGDERPTAVAPPTADARRLDLPVTRLAMPSRNGKTLELRPDSAGYNPALLAGVVPISKVFAREPRVERWAKPMETYLSDKVGTELPRLVPGVRLKRIECKTATCAVFLERVPGEGAAVNAATVRQMLAILYSPAAGEHLPGDLGFVLVYRGASWLEGVPPQSADQLITAIKERRTALLAQIHAQGREQRESVFYAVDPKLLPEQ